MQLSSADTFQLQLSMPLCWFKRENTVKVLQCNTVWLYRPLHKASQEMY